MSTIASSQRTTRDAELEVVQDDIDELRGQITDLEAAASAADSGRAADLGNAEQPLTAVGAWARTLVAKPHYNASGVRPTTALRSRQPP